MCKCVWVTSCLCVACFCLYVCVCGSGKECHAYFAVSASSSHTHRGTPLPHHNLLPAPPSHHQQQQQLFLCSNEFYLVFRFNHMRAQRDNHVILPDTQTNTSIHTIKSFLCVWSFEPLTEREWEKPEPQSLLCVWAAREFWRYWATFISSLIN